jgi:hypothetical protein
MWSSDVPIRPSARSVVIDLQRLLKPFGEKAMLQNATKLNKNARDLQKKGEVRGSRTSVQEIVGDQAKSSW